MKKIWNVIYVPMLFFMGALCMFVGKIEIGALFIIIGTNETTKN